MLPCTTKRTTTKLIKSNQNCQEIKLYRNQTTKESKKKHSSRLVGGAEVGTWDGRMYSKGVAGGLGGPIFACR